MKDALKVGDLFTVLVGSELPDPTDPMFGSLGSAMLRVREVCDGYVRVMVEGGRLSVGRELSLPLKYADYFRIVREPSAEWTLEERLELIALLAAQINIAVRHAIPDRRMVFDVSERIGFIAQAAAVFLELNRKAIINGQ